MPAEISFRAGLGAAVAPHLLGSRHVLVDMGRLVGTPARFPRSGSAYPVAPAPLVTDTVLLASPAGDATYYVPRYRLRTVGDRYDVHVEPGGDDRFTLRLVLDAFPAPELGEAARTAAVLPGSVRAWLTYGSPIEVRTDATATSDVEGGISVEFSLALAERDAVLWAFRSERGATLTLARSSQVAVPAEPETARAVPLEWAADAGIGQLRFRPEDLVPPVVERFEVPVENPDDVFPGPGPEPIVEALRLDAAGGDRLVLGTRMAELLVAEPVAEALAAPVVAEPADVVAEPVVAEPVVAEPAVVEAVPFASFTSVASLSQARWSRAAGLERRVVRDHRGESPVVRDHRGESPVVRDHREETPPVTPPPTEQQYTAVTPTFEWPVALRFDPAVHPYVFPGTAGTAGSAPSYERLLLPHGDRQHAYLRDTAVPHVFYHLPDAFRLGRTTTAPLRPALAFRVQPGEDGADAGTSVTFTCRIAPVTDVARLEGAAQALAAHVPERGGTRAAVELRPLRADARLTLGLPAAQEVVGDAVDVVNGFLFAESFPFDEFQDVYAALAATGDVSTVLRGTVTVSTGLAADDLVPVDLRFATAVGDVLASAAPAAAERGADAVDVVLRNASESPVRITALAASVRRGDAVVPGDVTGLRPPVELAADADLTVTVTPRTPLEGEGPLEVTFDTRAVEALPDPAAILALTLDRRVGTSVDREITVLTTPAKLAADPQRVVETVVVELAGATAPVTVDATTPQARGTVPVPLVDVLLRRDDGATFRYRQTLVTAAGETVSDAEWRTSDRSLLVVPVT